jgi:hypothetical protein
MCELVVVLDGTKHNDTQMGGLRIGPQTSRSISRRVNHLTTKAPEIKM